MNDSPKNPLSDYADDIDKKIIELFNQGVPLNDFPWDRLWLSFDYDYRKEMEVSLEASSGGPVVTRFRKAYKMLHHSDVYGNRSDNHMAWLYSQKYDPFKALKALKGDQIADAIANVIINSFLKTFEQHTVQPNDNRDKLAEQAMAAKINELCSTYPDLKPVFKPPVKDRDVLGMMIASFSEEQLKRYSDLRKIHISDGKIVAKPIKGSEILTSAMFAREAAAAEVGSWGQAKSKQGVRSNQETINPRGAGQRKPSDFS